MRIWTPAGDLAFKTFTFPDGQPHFKLETYEREFGSVQIELAIKSPSDLFTLLLANAVLRQHGYGEVNLDIRYLMGARMDRAISAMEPFSLAIVAQLINGAGFNRVRILDAHSEVATRRIRNSVNVLPFKVVEQVRNTIGKCLIVCPDKGALPRVKQFCGYPAITCEKSRDMATGNLLNFKIVDGKEYLTSCSWEDQPCLIIDDICDGGGTFTGLAKELRAAGAKRVFLFCTHGIFSKGLPLEGIDRVFTTDSYGGEYLFLGDKQKRDLTVIPVTMKELP